MILMKKSLALVLVFVVTTSLLLYMLALHFKTPNKSLRIVEIFESEFKSSNKCDEISTWSGEGSCFYGKIDNEEVLVLHPVSQEVPTFAYKKFIVPDNSSFIKLRLANVAGKIPYDHYYKINMRCEECDSLVRVVISDLVDKVEDEFVIVNREGWLEKIYDVSRFRGKEITLTIYAIAGGSARWNGEWLGISYVTFS